jgi:hypothetical protein
MATDWNYPRPRKGRIGLLDQLLGPGATKMEVGLEILISTGAMVAVVGYSTSYHLGWDWLQYLVSALIAFDIAGGVFTNATSAAKRWYHRPGQGFLQHFGFVAIHIHPLIVAWLFLDMSWAYFFIVYGYLLIATLVILLVPQYLQRPIAMAGYGGGLLLALYVLPQIPGLQWFVPFFYLKLLVSHLVKEEPYKP